MPELKSIVAQLPGSGGVGTFSIGQRIKTCRQERGLNLTRLAELSTVSKSNLSKVENGVISPTFETLERIAAGLNVTVAHLLSERGGSKADVTVTRRNRGRKAHEAHYSFEFLFTDLKDRRMVPFVTTVHPLEGGEFKPPASHGGEEFFHVLSGAVVLLSGEDERHVLKQGDSVYFDSHVRHLVVNDGAEASTLLWVWCQ